MHEKTYHSPYQYSLSPPPDSPSWENSADSGYCKPGKLTTIAFSTPDLTQVSDGTYTGNYARFPLDVEVEVVIDDHTIVQIDLLKHRNGEGQAAETIPAEVIREQSLEVDAVSGATYSSIVILKAIEDALLAET